MHRKEKTRSLLSLSLSLTVTPVFDRAPISMMAAAGSRIAA